MPLISYNRPTVHQTISTPINIGFAGSLQAPTASFFSLLTIKENFTHHETIVIGDETFQFVDPGILNKVSNDTYIAVLKLNSGSGIDFVNLKYALGRYTSTQAPSLAGFVPTLLDGVTLARTMSGHSFIVQEFRVPGLMTVGPTIPSVRHLIMTLNTSDTPPAFALHDLIHVGADIYEVLSSSSGTVGDRALTNNSYIPIDSANLGVTLADLASAINGTRVAYINISAGYLETDLTTVPPFVNGTGNFYASLTATGTSSHDLTLNIRDAVSPGGIPISRSAAYVVTLPAAFASFIVLQQFGTSGTMSAPGQTVNVCVLNVFNGQGTLGPKELTGGDQICQSGSMQIPDGITSNNGVYVNYDFVHDMAAISRLSDSGSTLTFYVQADADERPDPDVLLGYLFRVDLTPGLSVVGAIDCNANITPMHGDGTDSPSPYPTAFDVPHDENMDTWQTEVGRPRQDFYGAETVMEIIKIADYTLLPSDIGLIISNTGASGTVIITLPAAVALPVNGIPFRIRGKVNAGQTLRFQTSGTDVMRQGAGTGAAGGYLESNSVGAQVEIINDEAGKWVAAPLGPTAWGLA